MSSQKTGIVIVTYGDRWEYLSKTIEPWLGYSHVVLVIIDNASSYDLRKKLDLLQPQVQMFYYRNERNEGSAGGYAVGLRKIREFEDIAYVWLLDDDNYAERTVLQTLLTKHVEMRQLRKEPFALFANRKDRPYIQRVLQGEPTWRSFRGANYFLGFNIFRIGRALAYKWTGYTKKVHQPMVIPYAPYGGFFFEIGLLDIIGYPNKTFFLYADDFEFTYRFTLAGCVIYIIQDAIVSDLQINWQDRRNKGLFYTQFLDVDSNKVYFSTRNYIYFQKKYFVTNAFLFGINKIVFIISLFLLAIIKGKTAHFIRFHQAIKDGLSGIFDNKKYPI